MIRNSIFFLAFFLIWALPHGWGQDMVNLICYDNDFIAWNLSAPGCPNPDIDSLFVFIQETENSEFTLVYEDATIIEEIRDEALKTAHAVFVEYKIRCPDIRIIRSDTISLTALRQAVELDSVQVLSNGDVRLTWKEKPVSGVRYIVNSVVNGSSSVLASNISGNIYTDTRGLANDDIVYYSISASLKCGYTFPEPDSFYHTSWLHYEIVPCEDGVSFEFKPFSYWKGGTAQSTLLVFQNDLITDSVNLTVGGTSFRYDDLDHDQEYTFYVRESGNERDQIAYSNPVTFETNFEEPIRWIVINELTYGDNNEAILTWTTNNHTPGFPFELYRINSSMAIPLDAWYKYPGSKKYVYTLFDFPQKDYSYSVALQDSCGNTVESLPKRVLFTEGQLNGGIDLNITWTDIADEEWTIFSYDIYYETNGSYSNIGSANGSTFEFQHSFNENNPLDSVCYYVIATGEVYNAFTDSTTDLSIQSNTVCLHGETIVKLPNAYHPSEPPYRPIIVPQTNITSYDFRIFDRYGSLVFETNNPAEGWHGQHQGKNGFADVYVVQVELTNSQGELIKKSGSLMLFP